RRESKAAAGRLFYDGTETASFDRLTLCLQYRVTTVQVLENERGHGFHDRHYPRTDAGVVTALGADRPLGAGDVRRSKRPCDRGGGFHHDPEPDLLPGRNSAQDTARVVR